MAMLVELTTEADEKSFVIVLQHGGNEVMIIHVMAKSEMCTQSFTFASQRKHA